MYRQIRLLIAITAILAAGGAGAAEIRIGFANPLTGGYASTGNRNRLAVELAVADLNRHGGVLHQPVQLIVADDACGVDEAAATAQRLVDEGVRFVLGHLCSHSSLMAAAVYEAADVVMMTTTSSHPRLTEEGRRNVFRLIGRDDRQGRIAGDLLADRWAGRKIAILHDGSTYGDGLAEQTWRRLRDRGATETLRVAYKPGQEDYADLSERLRRAGIEVAYVGGYGPDAARILHAAHRRGLNLQLVGGHALGMAEFWSIAGAAGNGTIFTGRRDTGLGSTDAPTLAGAHSDDLEARPAAFAVYAAIQVWAESVERAGTLEFPAVANALRRGRFDTVLGRIAFDDKGDLEGADWQWQMWADGRYEVLRPAAAKMP
jgi:branched-chain amino acid transport system substrate-binding protein